jgi:hypothetical protein
MIATANNIHLRTLLTGSSVWGTAGGTFVAMIASDRWLPDVTTGVRRRGLITTRCTDGTCLRRFFAATG